MAERLLAALGGMEIDATFTTGQAIDPTALIAPDNTDLRRWVDHDELMPDVDLVIGHGGHGTTMRALAHDLPLLMLPMHPMVDQPMVARVVAEYGAGLAVPRTTSADELAAVIHRLLTEPSFRAAAARLGERIRARDGTGAACAYLRALAAQNS